MIREVIRKTEDTLGMICGSNKNKGTMKTVNTNTGLQRTVQTQKNANLSACLSSPVHSLPLKLTAWHACNRCPSGIHCFNSAWEKLISSLALPPPPHSLLVFLLNLFLSFCFSENKNHYFHQPTDYFCLEQVTISVLFTRD